MCILCTIKASKLGDRIMIESFLAVISYWTTGHMFSIGWFARSKVNDHDAWCDMCARKHLGSECVWCQETNQVKKTARKEFKVYGIKIVRIFLESYRIPNMVLQMSSVLGWHLWYIGIRYNNIKVAWSSASLCPDFRLCLDRSAISSCWDLLCGHFEWPFSWPQGGTVGCRFIQNNIAAAAG